MAFPFLALGYWGALFELAGSNESPTTRLTPTRPLEPRGHMYIMPRDPYRAEPAWAHYPGPRPLGLASGESNFMLVGDGGSMKIRLISQ